VRSWRLFRIEDVGDEQSGEGFGTLDAVGSVLPRLRKRYRQLSNGDEAGDGGSHKVSIDLVQFQRYNVILSRKIIDLLQPQERAQHECNVIFFTPGQYKIDIQCSAPDNSTAIPCLHSNGHIWRFTPPINVLVN
jgi:hypothetical protein